MTRPSPPQTKHQHCASPCQSDAVPLLRMRGTETSSETQLSLLQGSRPSVPARARGAPRRLVAAGLFSGVGGIELGLTRAGHHSSLLCEFERSALAVLEERFPTIPRHADVRTLRRLPKGTELVAAGFPCQDLSQAGHTRGISGARSGLVGEVFRLIEKERVPWVVLENVPFMLQLAAGEALEVIVATLEHYGYKWAYRVVDSRAFGLPQRRERVILVASLNEDPRNVVLADEAGAPIQDKNFPEVACGFYWTEGRGGLGWAIDAVPTIKGGSTIGIPSPPAIVFPDGRVVTPDIRDAERMQGLPVDWTAPALSVVGKGHRWRLVGNAVTVDVFKWLGMRLARPRTFDAAQGAVRIKSGKAWPRVGWNVGDGRFTAPVSAFPVARKRRPLLEFLRFPPTPLSAKATNGFLSRAREGSLRFAPGFLDRVAEHHARMVQSASAG